LRVLVDTGPIVAVLNRTDAAHRGCVETWRGLRGPFDTVWPVITEATHLVEGAAARDAIPEMVHAGALRIAEIGTTDLARIRELMARYADTPMDFADACLVRVGEREKVRAVFTLDRRGFATYAPLHVRRFTMLPKPAR
jgi:predicted nucleic acid-binding protein